MTCAVTQLVGGSIKTGSQVSQIHGAYMNMIRANQKTHSQLATISFFRFIFHFSLGDCSQRRVKIESKLQFDVTRQSYHSFYLQLLLFCFFPSSGDEVKLCWSLHTPLPQQNPNVYYLCCVNLVVTFNHLYQTHCYSTRHKLARGINVKQ